MKIDVLYEHLKKCNHLVSTDTRKVIKGSIFFALKGKNFDGNNYALEAADYLDFLVKEGVIASQDYGAAISAFQQGALPY